MDSRIVVLTDSDLPGDGAEGALRAAGFQVRKAASKDAADIIDAAAGASALVVQWAPITPKILDALPELQLISRMGIGVDMVDLDAATDRGVLVANTPSYCIEEVAAHTLAMVLAQVRGLHGYDSAMRAGRWAPTDAVPMAARPSATTVLLVGYGRIGRLVANWLLAIGFTVLVADPYIDQGVADRDGVELVSLESGLSRADVVSLHAPLTPETKHLLNAGTLSRLRPGAAIVNTCRGGLIDEAALSAALADGTVGGAALDVFEDEPLGAESSLREWDQVVLSPHAAWFSPESLVDLPLHAAQNVIDHFEGRRVASVLNPRVAGS